MRPSTTGGQTDLTVSVYVVLRRGAGVGMREGQGMSGVMDLVFLGREGRCEEVRVRVRVGKKRITGGWGWRNEGSSWGGRRQVQVGQVGGWVQGASSKAGWENGKAGR